MNTELLIQARNRIVATLNLYKKDQINFLRNLDINNYEFIDSKYGGRKYESYKDNQLYGNGSLYRISHNLRADSKLHIVIPHYFTTADVIWSKDVSAELPIACFSDHQKFNYNRVAQKLNIKLNLFSSVHPFKTLLYEIEKLKSSIKDDISPTENAIYFPLHSTAAIASNIHTSVENAKSKIKLIREKYQDLNLCIYYIDYIKLLKSGNWDSYRSMFNKVYCCGSRYEPAFLVNLALILKEHKYLVSEGVGGHIFFGTMANIKIDLLKYSDSPNSYKFEDSAQRLRNDHIARKHNDEDSEELHSVLDSFGEHKHLIINRYITYHLSKKEREIENNYNQLTQSATCRGFAKDFDSKIYPLIE